MLSENHFASRHALRLWLAFAVFVGSVMLAGCATAETPTAPVDATSSPTRPVAQGTVLPDANLGAPVIVNGKILWRIIGGRDNETATERAARISQQLDAIATNPFRPEVQVTIADTDRGTELAVGGQVIYIVTDQDALANNRARQELAQARANLIRSALAEARETYNAEAILRDTFAALVTIAVLGLLLWLVNRLYTRWRSQLNTRLTPREGTGTLQQTGIYRSGLLRRIALTLLAVGRLVAWFVLIVILFPLTLGFLPYTRPLYNQLREFVLTPLAIYWEGFLAYLPNLFFIGIIGLLTWGLIQLLRAFFKEIKSGAIQLSAFDPEWADLTFNLFTVLLIVLAVIVAFPYLPGSGSPAFQGITIFLGLLVTLSSSSAISNVIAGIILTYTGAFRMGDTVQLGGTLGIVMEKRLLTTRLRTFKNEEVSVPNSLALSNNITNYSALARGAGLILHTAVTIGYDAPWHQVYQLMINAAKTTPEILDDPVPFVLQTALNDYNVSYELNCYTRAAHLLPRVMSALHENIQNEFNAAGVEIMSPAFTALRDGNQITLEKDSVPPNYVAPSFRVTVEPAPLPHAVEGKEQT